MKLTRNWPLARGRSASGVALIIVLAFVVLLTGLLVAYFSRAMSERQISNSSASELKTDQFALGALDAIVADLKQEILAGSINTTLTAGASTVTISVPGAPASAVLCLAGTNGVTSFAPNLLKRSAYNQPFYSGTNYSLANNTITSSGPSTVTYSVPNRAAKVSTSGTSQNGRYISLPRWNKTLLLPKQTPTSATDLTPGANAFVPPDWVLVARSGTNPPISDFTGANSQYLASGTNPVLCRYAYAIYNEGGLLDANVAGYPTNTTPSQLGEKGSLAFADLTQVGLTQAQIDALVGWRNYASTQAPGAFPSPGFTTISASNYYNYVVNNTNGFLTTNGKTALYNGQSNRVFTSRQQLIQFMETIGTLGGNTLPGTQNALQYLGTFTRETNAPTYIPSPSRPRVGGTLDATLPASFTNNRAAVQTHDQTLSTYGQDDMLNPNLTGTANYRSDGTPVIKERFPLSRLAWLTSDGPSAKLPISDPRYNANGTDPNILKYFGLTWDYPAATAGSPSQGWIYNQHDQNQVCTSATSIFTLGQVAALPAPGREPDFFELLQSAIAVGSLAKDADSGPGQKNSDNSPAQNVWQRDRVLTYHILRIGACIIDQWDSTSYPTLIKVTGVSPPQEIYGVKNLPYMSKVVPYAFWNSGTVMGWFRFVLWNPHQAPSASPPAGLPAPTMFRLTGTGEAYIKSVGNGDPDTPPIDLGSSGAQVVFNSFTSGSSNFSDLTMLGPTMAVQGQCSAGSFGPPPPGNSGSSAWVGLLFASYPQWPRDPESWLINGNSTRMAFYPSYLTYPLTFTLQYQDNHGVWRNYDKMENLTPDKTAGQFKFFWHNFVGTSGNEQGTDPEAGIYNTCIVMSRYDPRSDRFGCDLRTDGQWVGGLMNGNGPGVTPTAYWSDYHHPPLYSTSKDGNGQASPGNITGFYVNNGTTSAPGYLYFNQSVGGSPEYYNDADGVLRPASGAYATVGANNTPMSTGSGSTPSAAQNTNNYASRPIILNRPFRSVAELGYAYRDLPWKNLDFFTSNSADAALLDIFSVNDDSPVVAGRVNPNTRNAPVITALLNGALFTTGSGSPAAGDILTSGTAIANQLLVMTGTQPMVNRSELVARLAPALSSPSMYPANTPDNSVTKSRREAAIRALADTANTRTWNLLIDVIAQTGRYPSSATGLNQFIVEGERRYWLHIAIDRYTGQVIDRSLEAVNE
jgi:Tfp pilus assembly protein PilX